MTMPPNRIGMGMGRMGLGMVGKIVMPLVILGAGIGIFVILGKGQQESRNDVSLTGPIVVRVAEVEEHGDELNLRVDGVAVPYREVELSAEVGGLISAKSPQLEAGEFITGGSPLVRIDPRDYELEVRRLTSMVQQAAADLVELDQELANNRELLELADKEVVLQSREYDRLQMLVGRGVVTQSEVERAEQAVLTARHAKVTRENQLNLLAKRRTRLESGLELAQSQLEKAELDVARTTVSSPVDGVVVREAVEVGAFVERGRSLATIEDTSRVEVRCSLEMDDLYWIWDQQATPLPTPSQSIAAGYHLPPTEVSIEYRLSGHDTLIYRWRGTLSRFDGIGVDEQTRLVPVRVMVDDPRAVTVIDARTGQQLPRATGPRALVRGMFVSVVIHARPTSRIVRVPDNALRPGQQILRVRDGELRILKDVRVVRRQEHGAGLTGAAGGSFWLVRAEDELRAGDFVVVGPLAVTEDGMRVTPVTETNRAALSANLDTSTSL